MVISTYTFFVAHMFKSVHHDWWEHVNKCIEVHGALIETHLFFVVNFHWMTMDKKSNITLG